MPVYKCQICGCQTESVKVQSQLQGRCKTTGKNTWLKNVGGAKTYACGEPENFMDAKTCACCSAPAVQYRRLGRTGNRLFPVCNSKYCRGIVDSADMAKIVHADSTKKINGMVLA